MKKLLWVFLLFCCLTTVVPKARAEGGSEKGETEKASDESPAKIALKWVNLLILLGGLGYLLKKPARDFFESRKNEISAGLERAKTAQKESALRMNEIEQRLSRLSSEIASLRTQAETESAQERENIIAEARRDMERLVDQSRQEIERIARGIERDIKVKIADAVIDRASQSLETQMTEDDQKRVVVRFLNKV